MTWLFLEKQKIWLLLLLYHAQNQAVAPEEIVCGIKKPKIRTGSIGLWTLCSRSCCCKSMANHILMSTGSGLGFPLPSNCTLLTKPSPFQGIPVLKEAWGSDNLEWIVADLNIEYSKISEVVCWCQLNSSEEERKNIFTVSTWGEKKAGRTYQVSQFACCVIGHYYPVTSV